MTKIQEIKLLKKMIREFGPNSYIGPWLKSNKASIEYAIAHDLDISMVTTNVKVMVIKGV